MNIENIIKLFNEKEEVHFKLFSLNYTIKKINQSVIIYADLYDKRKSYYKDINELLNNFTVFNETIKDNEKSIKNIN